MGDETTTVERDTVSVEAHQRIKGERDTFKASLDEATRALKGAAMVDAAYEHFKTKGVADPYGLAKTASRDAELADVSNDTMGERLDSWFEKQRSVWGIPVTADAPEPEPQPAPSAPPMGAARPAPSPANSGGQVRAEPMTTRHPEVQALLKSGNMAGLKELARQGLLIASPGNPLPPGIASR